MKTAISGPAHRARPRRPGIRPTALVAIAAAGAVWLTAAAPVTSAGVGARLEALRGDWPNAGGGTTRAAAAGQGPSAGSAYAFTGMPGQELVAFDPCDPVRYVISTEGRPPGSDPIVFSAVEEIAAATGLEFIYEGGTDERPSTHREKFQPERYGNRWAPVLIAWSDPGAIDRLDGQAAGLGGSAPVKAGRQPWVYVTGQVILDGPQLAPLLGSRHGDSTVKAVILHELAHVAGLAHVGSDSELMNPQTTGPAVLGAGDLEGLAALGRGACVAEY